jgi:hypothetical protein
LDIKISTKGKVSGGYLHIPWKNDNSRNTFDDKALIFSVTHRTLFRPTDNKKAVYFHSNRGPMFGGWSLGVGNAEMMNEKNNCRCYTKENSNYNVGEDSEGNSILTGDGKGTKDKFFTLDGIETYSLTYYP